MGGAREQMSGGVDRAVARGAGGGGPDHANPRSVRVEEGAVAGAELGQGSAVGAGEGGLFTLDRGRGGLEGGVWCEMGDSISHRGSMEVGEGGLVGGGVSGSVSEKVGN